MTKSVFVTLAGHTNAGKSSLLNAIIGEKIASVSPKPQTTRTRITGIKTVGETQMVFMDTPGLHKPTTKLSGHMLKAVKDAVADIDAVLFVQDCTKPLSEQEEELLHSLEKAKTPTILVLNKIDLCSDKTRLMGTIARLNAVHSFAATIPVSVTESDGIDLVEQEVMALAQPAPHYFPDEKFTDQPERVLAAEMIREKILNLLRDEVPHGIAVSIERMKERDDKDLLDIDATIYCERESHKGILIGKNGTMLRKIATLAGKTWNAFSTSRSICSAGSRSRRTGATRKVSSTTSGWTTRNNLPHIKKQYPTQHNGISVRRAIFSEKLLCPFQQEVHNMDAWDIFCMTGRIDDYLHYRRGLDGSVQQTAQAVQKEVPTHGDLSGTGSGGTERRRTGEVY